MQHVRVLTLALVGGALLWALPAWAQDEATPSADVGQPLTRFVQVQGGLGISPGISSWVPFYYTEFGASYEQTLYSPLGIRVGAEMFPGALNEWMTQANGNKTSFWGYAGDVDLTMSAAQAEQGGPVPYIALGNRVTYVSPFSNASPATSVTGYSMNLILGVKMAGGLVLETRYPLFSTNNGGLNPMPAYFETQIGWWKGF